MSNSSGYRIPLAPAPPGMRANLSESSNTGGKKRASTACTECKRKKTKCTRGIPCERCVIDGAECYLDEELDGRRKVALKRKVETLERTRDTLANFIHIVRNSEGDDPILQAIRGGASLDEVTAAVAARSQGSENTTDGDTQPASSTLWDNDMESLAGMARAGPGSRPDGPHLPLIGTTDNRLAATSSTSRPMTAYSSDTALSSSASPATQAEAWPQYPDLLTQSLIPPNYNQQPNAEFLPSPRFNSAALEEAQSNHANLLLIYNTLRICHMSQAEGILSSMRMGATPEDVVSLILSQNMFYAGSGAGES